MDSYQVTIDTYNKVAEVYQEKFMQMDLYDDTYNVFCDLLKTPNATIFEIGCGPGNITKYLLAKRPDFKVLGIDMAPNMVKLAKDNNPSADFLEMDCREISSIPQKFDAVMCGFCMPYLSKQDCSKLIIDSAILLKTGGIFYCSTMEDDYEKSGYETTSFSGQDEVFVYYHQETYLREQLINAGFEVLSLQRKAYPEPDGSFLTDIIFISRKK